VRAWCVRGSSAIDEDVIVAWWRGVRVLAGCGGH